MNYKTDKRTKNLTLRDIHVGDWVQVWSEQTERYSPPLKIIQICDDGTIYLIGSDEERPTPWEEDIKDVDALPITEEVLLGFGFEKSKNGEDFYYGDNNFVYNLTYHRLTHMYFDSANFFHEMQDRLSRRYNLNFKWKGIEK